MLKKVFTVVWFYNNHDFADKFIENCTNLEKYGWYWKIFTHLDLKSKGNVEIIPMSFYEYRDLANKKLNINCHWELVEKGIKATRDITDFSPAYGIIFDKWLANSDFWGYTNFDVVNGRLDKFVSDEFLKDCDVFGNDPDALCGPFSLYRNNELVNNLFREVPQWKDMFESKDGYFNFVEDKLTQVVRTLNKTGKIRFKSAFWQSHGYNPKLRYIDGSLYDDLKKGEEIMMFHANREKKWPL